MSIQEKDRAESLLKTYTLQGKCCPDTDYKISRNSRHRCSKSLQILRVEPSGQWAAVSPQLAVRDSGGCWHLKHSMMSSCRCRWSRAIRATTNFQSCCKCRSRVRSLKHHTEKSVRLPFQAASPLFPPTYSIIPLSSKDQLLDS